VKWTQLEVVPTKLGILKGNNVYSRKYRKLCN
jgi:hypothetical protein